MAEPKKSSSFLSLLPAGRFLDFAFFWTANDRARFVPFCLADSLPSVKKYQEKIIKYWETPGKKNRSGSSPDGPSGENYTCQGI